MTPFNMALTAFSADEQNKIKKKLADWSVRAPFGQRITRNLEIEHFIPKDRMEDIFKFILYDSSPNIETFESKYADECHKHVLQGGVISVTPFPKYFGVAIEKGILIQHLSKTYYSRFPDKKEAADFITGLKHGSLPSDCKDLFIKNYSIWTTWNESNPHSYPFEFCSTLKANEVRANLGLNKLNMSKELLLIIYNLPSHISVLRPTIADAELSEYFEPPPVTEERHGLTVTWKTEKWLDKLKIKLRSRPEGIHSRIQFRHLQLPIDSRW